MRANEFIIEYRLHKTDLGPVIQNPSAPQIENLIAKTENGSMRGIAIENDLWITDAYDTIHMQLENEFLMHDEPWVRLYFYPGGKVTISGWEGDWKASNLMGKMMGKMMGPAGSVSRDEVETQAFNFPSLKRVMR